MPRNPSNVRSLPLYNGATPQAPQQHFQAPPSAPHVQHMGGLLDSAINAGIKTFEKYEDICDTATDNRVEHELRKNDDAMEIEFQQKMNLPWGADGSFFTSEGRRNDDNINAFISSWQEKNQQIARPYWSKTRAMRSEAECSRVNDNFRSKIRAMVLDAENKNNKQNFHDNYELAIKQGDFAGAANAIARAVSAGYISPKRGEIMRLDLAKRGVKSGVESNHSIQLGDTSYTGNDALLAMDSARNPSDSSPTMVAPLNNPVQSTGVEPTTQPKSALESLYDSIAIPSTPPDISQLSPGSLWEMTGNADSVIPLLDSSSIENFANNLAPLINIQTIDQDDGSSILSTPFSSPPVIQRIVDNSNAHGGLTDDDVRQSICNIAANECYSNPAATTEQVLSVFNDSGFFDVLGAGDTDVGKLRAREIIDDIRQRAQNGYANASLPIIKKLIASKINDSSFGQGSEWKKMENLNPMVERGKEYSKKNNRERWFELHAIYTKYRHQFNSSLPPNGDTDEFKANAQEFYDWYMSHIYKRQKDAAQAAASDWYLAQISDSLRNKLATNTASKSTNAGFAFEIGVIKNCLSQIPPLSGLGLEETTAAQQKREKQHQHNSDKFRKQASSDYSKLREAKAHIASSKEEAKAAAASKKEQQKNAEHEKQERENRRLLIARNTPRQIPWAWDKQSAGDGAMPSCTIPRAEYKRLLSELGFDGSQNVYIRLNGASVLVTGVNNKNHIQLNTPAAISFQPKPNRKRNECYRTSGNLTFSYSFKPSDSVK